MLTVVGPETRLGDRYVLEERIAAGGMGDVWRGRDERLGRQVAVKLLRPEHASDPTFLTRFRNEARHTAGLSHPGIAGVFDYGEVDDTAYLVMELVDGEPLSRILEREHRLSPERTLDVLGQAALALQAAHEAGVVHRDVKPGNLLVRKDGVVKVTDFGIARALDAAPVTQTGLVVGTAAYLSPEQASGRPVTPASDVYSLGVVGYECLAGDRPFTGDGPVAVAMAHLRNPVPPLPGDVPAPVGAIVLQALQKEPSRRQPSAGDLGRTALAVRAALTGGGPAPAPPVDLPPAARVDPPTRALPTPIPEVIRPGRTRPEPGQRRVRTAFIVVGLLVVVLGALLLRACGGTSYADVPRVTADAYPTAAAALRKAGFTAHEQVVHDPAHPAGWVERQQPAAGARLATGSTVTLVVSSGPRLVTVDAAALVGRPFAEVQAALQALDLQVQRTFTVSGAAPDTVTAVSPTGQVREGTTVTVTTAAAPAPPPPHHHPKGKGDGGGG